MRRLFYILGFLFIISCKGEYKNTHFESFKNEEWSRLEPKEWVIELRDSGYYDMNLFLRHTTEYQYSDFGCGIGIRSDSGNWFLDTIKMNLADENGFWLGRGSTLKMVSAKINKEPIFFNIGQVRIRIEQLSEDSIMSGVHDIGLRLKKID